MKKETPVDINRELYENAKEGKLDKVLELYSKGASLTWKVPDGWYQGHTPLHISSNWGKMPVVNWLVQRFLEKGRPFLHSQVNNKDNAERIPLHYAAWSGHPEMCKYLLDLGSDLNVKDNSGGLTPLERAATSGYGNVVRLLLEKGADPTITTAHFVPPPMYNLASPYKELYAKFEVDVKVFGTLDDKKKESTFLWVLHHDRKDLFLELVKERSFNINQIFEDNRWRPLHYTCLRNNFAFSKILLERGANPSVRDKDGKFPVDLTINQESITLLSALQKTRTTILIMALAKDQNGNFKYPHAHFYKLPREIITLILALIV